jgi:hypothetical protein
VYSFLDRLEAQRTPGSIHDTLIKTDEARHFAWNLAAIVPWEQIPDPKPTKPGKPPLPFVTVAAREGIKAPNRLSDLITAAHKHRSEIVRLRDIVNNKESAMHERDRFGMAIREWDTRGGNWRLQVLYAILFDVLQRAQKGAASSKHSEAIPGGGEFVLKEDADYTEVLRKWQEFLDHLQHLDVLD